MVGHKKKYELNQNLFRLIKKYNMKTTKNLILIFVVTLFGAVQLQAQVIDEWEARPSLSLKYEHNDWSFTGTYYMYVDEDIKEYDKSELGAEIEYKINSWLDLGMEYRYGLEENEKPSHDIRLYASFDYDFSNRWELEYRLMGQQEFSSLKDSYLEEHPVEYTLRNKLSITYKLSKAWDLSLYTENYVQPINSDLLFHRQKTGVGAEYDFNKQNEIGLEVEIRNKRSGKNEGRINLGYTYTFN